MLAAYDYFLFDEAVESKSAAFCGVAINRGVPMVMRRLLVNQAITIMSNCWEFSPNYILDLYPVRRKAFFGTFRKWLPRNLVGDGCWGVQFMGLRACQSCVFDRRKLCPGQEIVRTGKNNLGFEIPILN